LKRITSHADARRRTHKRQRDEEQRRVQRKAKIKRRRSESQGVARPFTLPVSKSVFVPAPALFSLINNADEFLAFLSTLQGNLTRGRDVFVDLSNITELTPDALALLLVTIKRAWRPRVKGNFPSNPRLSAMVTLSGFLKNVHTNAPQEQHARGAIMRDSGHKVDGPQARALIDSVTTHLFGEARASKGTYSSLIEAMSNTRDHAYSTAGNGSAKVKKGKWWMTAYYDDTTKRASFTFVDLGVGILKSVKLRRFRDFFRQAGLQRPGILRAVMRGDIQSRTGVPYRGKGLPRILQNATRGLISRLTIVANNVQGDVFKDDYKSLRRAFSGTLLYWEIGEENYDLHRSA